MEWLNVLIGLKDECTPAPGDVGGWPGSNRESSQTHGPLGAGFVS